MEFNIDPDMVIQSVFEALEYAGIEASEEQFNKIAETIDNCMPGVIQIIAQGMTEHWRTEAEGAGGWGSKYAKAIQYKVMGTSADIYLDEEMIDKESHKPNIMFAEMMEKGVKTWSIKDALLASDKAKTSSDGIKYIVIPFPVATPRHKGQGKMKNYFGGREMTTEIYNLVKSGGKLDAGTLTVRGKDVDISGLSKYNTKQLHGQYGIFRCVSEKSKGWQYPYVPAEPVFQNVLNEVNRKIDEIVKEFCVDIVKEFTR